MWLLEKWIFFDDNFGSSTDIYYSNFLSNLRTHYWYLGLLLRLLYYSKNHHHHPTCVLVQIIHTLNTFPSGVKKISSLCLRFPLLRQIREWSIMMLFFSSFLFQNLPLLILVVKLSADNLFSNLLYSHTL